MGRATTGATAQVTWPDAASPAPELRRNWQTGRRNRAVVWIACRSDRATAYAASNRYAICSDSWKRRRDGEQVYPPMTHR